MQQGFADVADALTNYFDGFHTGDIEALKAIFHPACHLYSGADGHFVDDDMETVYARVAGRTPPSVANQKRMDKILSIDLAGPEMALAKVQLAIGPKLFTDYLNMLKIDGRWWITAKTFTYVPLVVEQNVAQAAE